MIRCLSLALCGALSCLVVGCSSAGMTFDAKSLALTDGVKPQALVLADALARLQLYHIARVLAQITADIVIIINLPQEADALAILALGIHQMLLLSYLSNFIFHMMTDRKYRFS